MKRVLTYYTLSAFIVLLVQVELCAQDEGRSYWNNNIPLVSYRLPPPPIGYKPVQEDLDGDGDPDIIYSVTIRNTPIMWIDDDDDLREGDFEGDTDSDCLLIDVNKDGKYCDYEDIAVDWIDKDGDGMADMQVFIENAKEGAKKWGPGHYFWVIDSDKDNVFNYIDWNTFEVRAWLHEGSSNFFEDYVGQSTFLKAHTSTYHMEDVRLNWENPFLFFDHDGDGLTEMAFRALDSPKNRDTVFVEGKVSYVGVSFDLDNDNAPGNEFDYDMSFRFRGEGKGFDYMDQVHKFKNVRVEEADKFFKDPRWRQVTELIYPDFDTALDLTYNRGEWDNIYFSYDEDDDCERWERVEFYDPKSLFTIGGRNGGLDNNLQADAIGDRGEWDLDNSGKGNIYISKFDGRIHLYGAEWGAWRVDQLAYSYQGFGGMYDTYTPKWERLQKEFTPFSTFKYEDTDNNGFIDQIEMDIDGDTLFEKSVSLLELGIDDKCEIIDAAKMSYEDYRKLHTSMSEGIWAKAQAALDVADKLGLNTSWYAFMKNPKSDYQKYSYGYWLQFYVYMDLLDQAKRVEKGLKPDKIDKAYFEGNWEILLDQTKK
ncbi:hypothetical protein R9C00_19475 [Flammeovirgaceae bacterium SG7u.111]|nr:hypothetical protein [Flammeovirgaceae bacterium SG7u.132]WPO33882.1 hypothetical protein R9C00_19475 [Flammeovirgaceae bacterium SG7u.111]